MNIKYFNKSNNTMAEVKRYYNATGLFVVNYTYNGVVYVGPFPEEWAKNHIPNTGPNECGNCVDYGSICSGRKKMFLGYCANCARDYGGERGRGLIGFGEENPGMMCYPSIYDMYMKEVNLESLDTSEVSNVTKSTEFDMWYYESDMDMDEGEPSNYKVVVRNGVILDTDTYEANIAD